MPARVRAGGCVTPKLIHERTNSMTNLHGIITEDIETAIKPGLTVFDREGAKVGTVDMIDRFTGYFMVHENERSETDLSVPFRLIKSIDPREIFVSRTKSDLQQEFSGPPPTTTKVMRDGDREMAITTQPSGYDGLPLVID